LNNALVKLLPNELFDQEGEEW
jgi:hypothetical protein